MTADLYSSYTFKAFLLYEAITFKLQRNSGIPAVCKVYALCDYAFGIFGGWDNLTLQAIQIQQLDNANTMFEMLLRNGFSKKKIQLYFHQRFPSESKKLLKTS